MGAGGKQVRGGERGAVVSRSVGSLKPFTNVPDRWWHQGEGRNTRFAILTRSLGNPGERRGGGAVPSPCPVLPPPYPSAAAASQSSGIPAFHVAAATASPAEAVPTLPSGWCRRPRPLQGLGSARRGRRPTGLGPRTRAGAEAGRGGERACARGAGGGPRAAILDLDSAASRLLRAAGTGILAEPRARAREDREGGGGGEGKEGSGCERGCGILCSPQPRHQSLLRRLGRLPARRGKMPLTQGCEEGAEVAAGAPRAAAAAAVRVL